MTRKSSGAATLGSGTTTTASSQTSNCTTTDRAALPDFYASYKKIQLSTTDNLQYLI